MPFYFALCASGPCISRRIRFSPAHSWILFNWKLLVWITRQKCKKWWTKLAQPIGILALITLNSTLTLLWCRISYAIKTKVVLQQLILFCGIGSVLFSSFIFTNWHDLLIGISVLMRLIAILLTLFLFKRQHIHQLGLLCVILIALNVTIYFTNVGIYYLPLLQKFTFVCVLLWFIILNLTID